MGTVSDNMKIRDKSDSIIDIEDKAKDSDLSIGGLLVDLFSGFFKRKEEAKKPEISNEDEQQKARTFAELISKADDKFEELFKIKQKEYETEVSDKAYNKRAISHMLIIRGLLDRLIQEICDYSELRKN